MEAALRGGTRAANPFPPGGLRHGGEGYGRRSLHRRGRELEARVIVVLLSAVGLMTALGFARRRCSRVVSVISTAVRLRGPDDAWQFRLVASLGAL